jgi:hypothetical protein
MASEEGNRQETWNERVETRDCANLIADQEGEAKCRDMPRHVAIAGKPNYGTSPSRSSSARPTYPGATLSSPCPGTALAGPPWSYFARPPPHQEPQAWNDFRKDLEPIYTKSSCSTLRLSFSSVREFGLVRNPAVPEYDRTRSLSMVAPAQARCPCINAWRGWQDWRSSGLNLHKWLGMLTSLQTAWQELWSLVPVPLKA